MLYGADNGSHGWEIWRSDGTPEGTFLLKDIYPGTGGWWPGPSLVSHGVLYFSIQDPEHGVELWRTDGTAAGTYLVADIFPGTGWSNPV